MRKSQKQAEIEKALMTILNHCPCYGVRNEQPLSIEIGNGLALRDENGRIITIGTDNVSCALLRIGKEYKKETKKWSEKNK